MKKILFGLVAIVGIFAVSQEAEASTKMYRLYNPNNGEHFYTEAWVERDSLFTKGWNYEDVAWLAPSSGEAVYRMYNPNAGDHHYTRDKNEVTMLKNSGWKEENIGWYSDSQQRVPMYRLYNPNAKTGTHHYTANQAEVDQLKKIGWEYEGIGWYAENVDTSTGVVPANIRGNFQGTNKYDGSVIRVAFAKNEIIAGGKSYVATAINSSGANTLVSWDVAEFEKRYNVKVPGPQAFWMRPEGNHYIYGDVNTVYKK
ncbi:hypothetical protein M2139_001902 [Enterococcus sp. PF1-24]|uniref:hypothetical protein n=1 Tax=unclassified Enterococcus TaxID=2608891 RepID=UPI00247702A6|nr:MULTISPECIES: hypothetical protein [unclassified Enterococcus]MDH6364901.1 hypothetical protein [Enterococcus sp. PFB1-1]MDH6402002.1 hypothetical protein [Enterococcus sp. PF1-24]